MIAKLAWALVFLAAALVYLPGCSINQYAVRSIGDMLAEGDSVYESDDDIALVGDALPFSLKLLEVLLSESPDHPGLLAAAARGFTIYAYGYVHFEADLAAAGNLTDARQLRNRARRLYDRAHRYAMRGLEHPYPGLEQQLIREPQQAVLRLTAPKASSYVPLIYWSAASLGLAISTAKDDMSLLARLEEVEALLAQAIRLDENWNNGALHEFRVVLAGALPDPPDEQEIRDHYQQALRLSSGTRASLYLALAESVSVPNQDRDEFESLIANALAVDPDDAPRQRLANLFAQRRARWLLERADELFLE